MISKPLLQDAGKSVGGLSQLRGEGGGASSGGAAEGGRRYVLEEVTVSIPRDAGGDVKVYELVHERKEVGSAKEVFLLDVGYDGERGKAYLVLYDPKKGDLIYWYDKTGHKPYFIVDIPPDKVLKNTVIVKHASFDGVEVVEKHDLLRGEKRRFTKIVTKDPLAVRYLRTKVAAAWEADIRYHINYIYDLQLVPGISYNIEGAKLEPAEKFDEAELLRQAREVLGEESDRETLELALQLLKLFEAKWFSPRRVAIDIEVFSPFRGRIPNPEHAEYPVISIAFAANDGFRKVLVLYRPNVKSRHVERFPADVDVEVEFFYDEKGLLLEAFRIISSYPILLTFNGDNFDLRYLYNRAIKLGIPPDYIPIKIRIVRKGGKEEPQGRLVRGLHVDLYKFFNNRAIQTYAFGGKYKEFTLDAVSNALLGVGKVSIDEEISKLDLPTLVSYNLQDADITLRLTTFNDELVWKLMILLMRISKLGLEDVTRTTVSVWIKNLFYWEHRRNGMLIPRREEIKKLKGRKVTAAIIKGKKYQGAIVIDPPRGVFFNVVVLDYASLYPSIIKRWNLSYETVDPEPGTCRRIAEVVDEKGEVIHTVCMDRHGITAQIVGLLRDFRVRIYKKKAKDKNLPTTLRSWYDVVQQAMKVYINASYGVFGAESFSLYAPSVAESVTALGRRVITSSIQKARELGLKVLYGDTDSLFIWHPDPERLEELRRWVEENFGLELEVDKVYKFVAFALKKNYVGVLEDGSIDIKGLVGKKRNVPDFIKKLFIDIVNDLREILEPEDVTKVADVVRERLLEVYTKLKHKLFTLDEVAYRVALSKPLSEYRKSTPQHVKAALQLANYGINVFAGDIITFIKTKSKDGVKPVQLAKVTEIDVQKYMDAIKSALEQLLAPFNIAWEDISGSHRLVDFVRV